MASVYDSFGANDYFSDIGRVENFIKTSLQDALLLSMGKTIDYLDYSLPSGLQFISSIEKDGGKFDYVGMDVHHTGECIWDFTILGLDEEYEKEFGEQAKSLLYVLRPKQGSGFITTHIIGHNAIGRFDTDDEITLQMVGFAVKISAYKSEDEFVDSINQYHDGRKLILSDGLVVSTSFLASHNPDNKKPNYFPDDVVEMRGNVVEYHKKSFIFENNKISDYYVIKISTKHGLLDIIATPEMLNKSDIKIGDIIYAQCILSGLPQNLNKR